MTTESILIALRRAARWLRKAVDWTWHGLVWLFAPVVTSVHRAWDANDLKPMVTKMLVLGAAAKVTLHEALKDPEIATGIGVLVVAIVGGILEAITRAGLHPTPTSASAAQPTATNTNTVSAGQPDATQAVPSPPTPTETP